MNARQKAKFYKKKYEQLANTPFPTTIVTSKNVRTLCVRRNYPVEMVESATSPSVYGFLNSDYVMKNLANDMWSKLKKHIHYSLAMNSYGYYEITAKLDVLDTGMGGAVRWE